MKVDHKFDDKNSFINPYNFVPNGRGKIVGDSKREERFHTGILHCRLITKTPIIIPDTAQRQKTEVKDHYKYPFMKINGNYAIPGSSIRGPVRSVYETMTNSCYATVREDQIVSNRAVKPFKPGLLQEENGTWKLYEADRYKLPKDKFEEFLDKSDYGQKVWFTASGKYITNIYDGKKAGTEEGCLFRGEPFPGKKNESVFVYKDLKKPLSIDDKTLGKAVIHLENLLIDYHEQKDRNQEDSEQKDRREPKESHNGYKRINQKIFKEKNVCIPVWYEYKGQNLHLSFAQIGRYTYEKSLNEILGSYDACKKRENCCAACRLFGMAAKDEAAAGKVRFTDAEMVSGRESKVITLAELGTPHITYLPFYMENALDYDANGARIRGRKYYWHHIPDEEKVYPSTLNASMEQIYDAVFEFSVYYDRVTEKQLKELMWVLCLGENNASGSMCHKIGHAKPLGYGSVKIVIERRQERTYSDKTGYIIKTESIDESFFADAFDTQPDQSIIDALKAILNFNTIPESKDVRYPYVEPADRNIAQNAAKNDLASHKWYSTNHSLGKKPTYLLPEITSDAEKMELPGIKVVKKENDYGGIRRGNDYKQNRKNRKHSGGSGENRKRH